MIATKKLLRFIVLIFIILCYTYQSAYAETVVDDEFLKNQAAAFNSLDSILALLKKVNLDENIGGMFLDDTGTLNINLTGDADKIAAALNTEPGLSNLKWHNVKFTKEYLQSIMDIFISNYNQLGLDLLELDESDNKVIVGLKDFNQAAIDEVNMLADPEAIEVIDASLITYSNSIKTVDVAQSTKTTHYVPEQGTSGLHNKTIAIAFGALLLLIASLLYFTIRKRLTKKFNNK